MKTNELFLTAFCTFMLITAIIIANYTEQSKNALNRIETHYLNKVDSLIQKDIEREEMYDRWKEKNNIGYRDYLD